MQLRLGRGEAASIEVILHLAVQEPSRRMKAREIAEAVHVSPRSLPAILAALVHAGLLTAHAGCRGGYQLARPASEVTLLDVIEAAAGTPDGARCPLTGDPPDGRQICALHRSWSTARQRTTRELGSTSVAELAQPMRVDE